MTVKELFEASLHPVYGAYADDICSYYFSYQKHFKIKDSIEQLKLDGIFFLAQYDLNRLLAGVPVQHVVGLVEIMGQEFCTTPAALIPRPETEELIHFIHQKHQADQELNVLDIGTGTGIIPISLKKLHPNWSLFGLDISKNALRLASNNAQKLNAAIQLVNENIFAYESTKTFDIIISNPPYIPREECLILDESVRKFEPILALEVPDEDPLLFYKAILTFSLKHLTKNGCLYLEIHQNFGEEMIKLVSPHFANCTLKKDFANNDRFVLASNPKI